MEVNETGDRTQAGGVALFETSIGLCAIGWVGKRIVAVQLPEADERAARARIRRRRPDAAEVPPPAAVVEAIDSIRALLAGDRPDLRAIELEMGDVAPFDRLVYEEAREIPPGETRTYGELARRIGLGTDPRQVGRALGRNPFPIVVPCHRVVAAGGLPGGFSARGGVRTKLRLLSLEGAGLGHEQTLFEAAQ